MNAINNYLIFPSCQSEESINRCRFALLKMLGLYNLRPAATISIVIYTDKAAQFEIFQPFFKDFRFVESAPACEWKDLQGLQHLLSPYKGNALVCYTNGYLSKPVEDLFLKISSGALVYCRQPGTPPVEQWGEACFNNMFATGISTAALHQSSPEFFAVAENCAAYFFQYKVRNGVSNLLKTFFQRNEEESITNLVKKARSIDIAAIEEEAEAANRLPFYKRWFLQLRGKNTILQEHLNRL